jgi:chromosomal replication initiator protein
MDTDLNVLWATVLDRLRNNIESDGVETWLKPSLVSSICENKVTLDVPNKFFIDQIKSKYISHLVDILKNELKINNIEIIFTISKNKELENIFNTSASPQKNSPTTQRTEILNEGNIDGRYSFESFVVGSGNQFAYAASRKVAEQPGLSYNPLFIYAGVGLGKTHLLGSIGSFIAKNNPKLKILYISTEQFTNSVVYSIRNDKMVMLRNSYRNNDILLIDDIQFLSGKERTQEEFFHTFNSLYEAKKQLVITSDRMAKDIPDIDERLRSRFEMGLIADIQPPDLETRIAILEKKAERESINLPNNIAIFIATHISKNIRVLEGALIRLGAFTSLTGQPLTLDTVRRVLGDTIKEREKQVHIDSIQKCVAERFQVKSSDLKSKKRTKNIVTPRHICMYLCRELTALSFPEIGQYFGGRDHSTVIHGCKQVEHEIGINLNTKTIIQNLITEIKRDTNAG